MLILGLTGSIGMGKTATAELFSEEGIPIHDSDRAVHRLYKGSATAIIEQHFPGTVVNGKVDRTILGQKVFENPQALQKLQSIIHPLVQKEEEAFIENARRANHEIILLDIPLLFETGAEKRVNITILVTAPYEIQKQRVLQRADMTEEKLLKILGKQMADEEKRKRAHFIIDTGKSIPLARQQVKAIVKTLTTGS